MWQVMDELLYSMCQVQKRTDVVLNMAHWIHLSDNKCEVCAAGAWLITMYDENAVKTDFSDVQTVLPACVMKMLRVMNSIRRGSYHYALSELSILTTEQQTRDLVALEQQFQINPTMVLRSPEYVIEHLTKFQEFFLKHDI